MPIFTVENLTCVRQGRVLFETLDFALEAGELLQLRGTNGSGKSSLLQICAGLVQADCGSVYWNGQAIQSCRNEYQTMLCYVGHKNGIRSDLSVQENIQIMQALTDITTPPAYNNLLAQLGLLGTAHCLLNRLSAGQKRRVSLTRLLMTKAKLWLLDEPFNTLDGEGKKIIEQLIINHCHAGGMAIVATHQQMDVGDHPLKKLQLGA